MSKQHSDGGWGLVPIQSRAGRFSSFDVADFEPVSGFEAEWKYTPVRELAALLDGALDGARYDVAIEPGVGESRGISVDWVARTDPRIGSVGKPE
ncbi:MAG TPA: Fe-S cluster assembly protein SufD, partial [Terrimesophilobacter sp.]|nr:Fe-S cluster assembly protein SufD [Terrimesophilobacter sp.]